MASCKICTRNNFFLAKNQTRNPLHLSRKSCCVVLFSTYRVTVHVASHNEGSILRAEMRRHKNLRWRRQSCHEGRKRTGSVVAGKGGQNKGVRWFVFFGCGHRRIYRRQPKKRLETDASLFPHLESCLIFCRGLFEKYVLRN